MSSRKTAPSLRFRGFSEPWEERFVKNFCSISTGKSNTQDRVDGGRYPFYVRSPIVERSNRYLFDEEAVLTVGDGVGTGKVFHYVNGKYDLHQRVYRMFEFSKDVNAKYFYYYFSNHFYDRVMAMTAKTSVDSVRYEMIADMGIMLPKVREQIAVTNYFEHLDRLIALEQRKYDKLNTVKKSMLEKMFPQKGAKVPEIRFKGFSDPWEEKKLGEIFTFKYGNGNNNPSNGGKYPVFGAGGVQGGYSEYNAENSVIIGHMGDAGCVSWGEGKHYVTYNGTITKPKDHIFSAKFGYYLLFHMNLRKYRGGSGLPFLTYDMLTEMETVYPADRFETDCIEMVFSNLDRLITLQSSKIEKLRNLKKACLEKMFV